MADAPVSAFVPGHVTGFFSPQWKDDPARTGSIGAGLTLSDGVRVTVEPAERSRVELDGDHVAMEAVERVLKAVGHEAVVTAESAIPLGMGFGVSGAVALGTALAANQRFDLRRSENDLITLAHRAEVLAGTGLGDVVAQARGGIPIRLAPGAPGHCELDGIPTTATVEYVTFGELDTGSVLRGDTTAIESAGATALADLRSRPTLPTLAAASRRFSRETGLLTESVAQAIRTVDTAGSEALMAMLGDTVVALGGGLRAAGYDAHRCSIHPAGATIERG